nr:MAG TPA: hypothetical protein [Caudoviricetes sp.]
MRKQYKYTSSLFLCPKTQIKIFFHHCLIIK